MYCDSCGSETLGASRCGTCGAGASATAAAEEEFDPDKTVDRSKLRLLLAREEATIAQAGLPGGLSAGTEPSATAGSESLPLASPPNGPLAEPAEPVLAAVPAPAISEPAAVPTPTPVNRFCGNCGRPAGSGAFCGGCGTAIPPVGSSPVVPVVVAQPVAPLVAEAEPPQTPAGSSWKPAAQAKVQTGPTYGGLAGLNIDRRWSARLRRGWQFSIRSLELMKDQPGLIVVPVITATTILVQLIIIGLIGNALPSVLGFLWDVAGLISVYTVAVTGQAVIVVRIGAILNGGQLSNRESLQAVLPRMKDIVTWAAISFTVGTLIRSLERVRGPIGWIFRLIAVAMLVAWSALTFFVVPVMMFEGLSARASITRSRELVRQVWGEGVVGVGVLNVVFNLAALVLFILCFLLAAAHAFVLAILLFIVTIVAFNLLAAVVSPIFTVVMYRFATAGEVSFGFSAEDLAASMRPRRSTIARRW